MCVLADHYCYATKLTKYVYVCVLSVTHYAVLRITEPSDDGLFLFPWRLFRTGIAQIAMHSAFCMSCRSLSPSLSLSLFLSHSLVLYKMYGLMVNSKWWLIVCKSVKAHVMIPLIFG